MRKGPAGREFPINRGHGALLHQAQTGQTCSTAEAQRTQRKNMNCFLCALSLLRGRGCEFSCRIEGSFFRFCLFIPIAFLCVLCVSAVGSGVGRRSYGRITSEQNPPVRSCDVFPVSSAQCYTVPSKICERRLDLIRQKQGIKLRNPDFYSLTRIRKCCG